MDYFILKPVKPIKASKPSVILNVEKQDIDSYTESVDPLSCVTAVTIDGNMFEKMMVDYALEKSKLAFQ